MADDVNALAQEYFDYLLTVWPTWGHLMGNYQHAELYDDASRAVRATVYDFKTDRSADDAALVVAAARHAAQIGLYRRVVAVLTGLAPTAVSAELVFTSLPRRVTVPQA